MNFAIEELGSLRDNAEWQRKLFAESNWHALAKFGNDLKEDVRDDVRKSGIKRAARLAGSWRGRMFPARPQDQANKPAYVLGSNAPNVIDTFERGPLIRAKGGGLLIPIGPAKRIKLRIGQRRTELPMLALQMYGQTRFVSQRMKKTRQLVLGVFTSAEGARKFIPLFLVVTQVQAPKLLSGRAIIEKAAATMPSRVSEDTFRLFEWRLYNSRQGKAEIWRKTFDSAGPYGSMPARGFAR